MPSVVITPVTSMPVDVVASFWALLWYRFTAPSVVNSALVSVPAEFCTTTFASACRVNPPVPASTILLADPS